jgi:hypothetical protein
MTDRLLWVALAKVWTGWRQASLSCHPTPLYGGSIAGSARVLH